MGPIAAAAAPRPRARKARGRGADLMHLPALIRKFGPLPNCWSLERKHKTVKKYANHLFRSSAGDCGKWDRSVLRDVTAERMFGIEDDEFAKDVGLLQPIKPVSRRLASELAKVFTIPGMEFRVANHARLNECDRVSVSDAAVLWDAGGGYGMGMVRQLVAITCPPRMPQPFHAALVERWAFRDSSHGASVWTTAGARLQWVAFDEIMRVAPAWSIRDGGRAIALNPPAYS